MIKARNRKKKARVRPGHSPNQRKHRKKKEIDLQAIEKARTAAVLSSFKKESAVLQEQRKKLRTLSKVIEVHFKDLEQNIHSLSLALKNKSKSKNALADVKSSVKKLQQELARIEHSRKNLVTEERRILSQLHTATSKKDIKKAQTKHSSAKLKEIETTLEYLLDEADYLLRQGREINTSHFQIMQEIATKEKGAIAQLTKRLLDLKKERDAVLNKKKLVKVDGKQIEKKIQFLRKRQKAIKAISL